MNPQLPSRLCVAVLSVLLSACEPSASVETSSEQKTQLVPTSGTSVEISDNSRIFAVSEVLPSLADRWPQAKFASTGLIAPTEQRQGDPVAGRKALLEKAYVSCGLPERVFREVLADAPVTEVSGRTQRADGLPYSANVFTNAQGVNIVSSNCLTCHATPLFGELVVGLGNEFLDFTQDASAAVERAGALVQGAAETQSWELYADRIAAISPYIRPHTIGVNPANNLTFTLIAHRDPDDNAWSEEALLPLPPTDPAPVSVPPWWRMSKKPAMFNMGEGRGDHARIMMAASMLCSDTPESLAEIDAFAPDIRAFIASLDAPGWPFDVDTGLAAEGQVLFEATCSRCHGSYGPEGKYPARLVSIDEIQTDATLVTYARTEGVAYIDWFNRSYFGETAMAAPGAGYVAPPLDGVWATGPFLHNGSVPSIRTLLDSKTRPQLWSHMPTDASDTESYDQVNLGWQYEALKEGDLPEVKPVRVYDTRLPGYANTGHLFGDHLNDEQRSAVIEYLKTL